MSSYFTIYFDDADGQIHFWAGDNDIEISSTNRLKKANGRYMDTFECGEAYSIMQDLDRAIEEFNKCHEDEIEAEKVELAKLEAKRKAEIVAKRKATIARKKAEKLAAELELNASVE